MPLNPRTLVPSSSFTPRSISGLALWLDGSDTQSLYTTDAGPVTAVSSPLDIATPALWLDASDAASITESGGLVSQWNDKSGNNRHATASSTARPTTGTRTVGGRNALDFNGTANSMATGGSAFPTAATHTVFLVYQLDSASQSRTSVLLTAATIGDQEIRVAGFGSTAVQYVFNNNLGTTMASIAIGLGPIVFSAREATASMRSAGAGVVSTTSGSAFAWSSGSMLIGSRTAGNYVDGLLCEVIIYPTTLTDSQTASVEAYLAAKWGISGVHRSAAQEIAAVNAPTDLAGCVGWWDASDAASITASGGLVSQINDKSGLAAHASQGTSGSRPTLVSNALNGRSVLRFDGGDALLGNFASTISTNAYSVFAVCKVTVGGNNFRVFSVAGAASSDFASGSIIPCCQNAGVFGQLSAYDGVAGNVGAVSGFAGYALFSGVRGSTTVTNAADGIKVAPASTTLTTPVTRFGIGAPAQGISGGALWNGDIAEVIYYSAALSDTDRARVEKYLQQKWGTTTVPDPTPPVGAWLDKSGNGRHAVQATAGSRPTISATTQGGRKALAFASQSQTVVSPVTFAQYIADATTSPKMVFAWVARPEGSVVGITFGSPTHPNTASRVFYSSDFGSAGSHIVDFGSVSGARLAGIVGDEANNVGHVYSAFRDGAVMSIRRDGVEILRKTNATGVYTDTTGTLAINTAGGGSSTASWMEFMAYAASMPASNITRLERYLAAKWGITLAPQVSNADAQDWVNRVYANGGSVTSSTAAAVNTLCDSLDAASLRDRFYRLNLFCGSNLNAALVPLYRGPSLGGTQYGGTTDTNVGPFVSGDYAETGATGGLVGNGSTKYLNTGLAPNALPSLATGHLAVYRGAGAAANQTMIAVRSDTDYYELLKRGDSRHHSAWGQTSLAVAGGSEPSHEDAGLRVASRTSATLLRMYQNGTGIADQTASVTPAGTARAWFVFAMNQGTLANYWGNATPSLSIPLRGYSIGSGMSDADVTAYTNAMNAFQTALSRA